MAEKIDKNKYGKIDFLSSSPIMGGISLFFVIASIIVIMANGFNYGIDFAGGTEFQIRFGEGKVVQSQQIRDFVDEVGYKGAAVQSFGDNNEVLIRMGNLGGKSESETNKLINDMIKKLRTGLETTFAAQDAKVLRVDSVGPQIGDELKRNGILAAFYSLLMILIYIGFRFDFKYAPGAVICLFHDAIITLGVFSLFQREVNVQTMAAILTIIGYSLNDTIVTFDRIRENVGVYRGESFFGLVNLALNEVLSRSILTSLTTMLAVLAMFFIAGGVIKDFAFTLGIGIIVGTYSSVFIASPLVILVDRMQKKSSK